MTSSLFWSASIRTLVLVVACLVMPFAGAAGESRAPALLFTLDETGLEATLNEAPPDGSPAATSLSLPLPDGTRVALAFRRSAVMAPELAARFPRIRAFVGQGSDSRTRARFEKTHRSFQAVIWSPAGLVVIEPVPGESGRYSSAFAQDVLVEASPVACDFEPEAHVELEMQRWLARGGGVAVGDELRTYRSAVAATGEYTINRGGTVEDGMAGIVSTMNAVTEIYEREFSVRLQLVPNNELVVYADPATDPYSNGQTFAMLGENQSNLDSVIGAANYDIGHVFGTGPGGVGSLASVCRANFKARGVSTSNPPSGIFYNLLVAHEMGHQFGALHSFNGDAGNCGPNRSGSAAYEPGSGSTVMGYAGICGDQNIQLRADDYFNAISYDQIVANVTSGIASGCPASTATGNSPPVPVAGNVGLTIPLDTPFELDGAATDADGDSLTYCWEQFDRGPAGHPDFPVGDAPIFRSFLPKTKTNRFFPRLGRTLSDTHVIGELLPTYARTLHFRLTVRDNLGGVNYDTTELDVDGSSGPFVVTSPSTNVVWFSGSEQTVTWDVANTDKGPVNCQVVNVLLSDNGGFAYPFVLAAATPNDGSETIVVPAIETTRARIKVEPVANVFFDVSDEDFVVTTQTGVESVAPVASFRLEPARPNPFASSTTLVFSLPPGENGVLTVHDAAGRLVRELRNGTTGPGPHALTWDGTSDAGERVGAGVYFVRLESARDVSMRKIVRLR